MAPRGLLGPPAKCVTRRHDKVHAHHPFTRRQLTHTALRGFTRVRVRADTQGIRRKTRQESPTRRRKIDDHPQSSAHACTPLSLLASPPQPHPATTITTNPNYAPPSDCLGMPAIGGPTKYLPAENFRCTEPTGAPASALTLRPVIQRSSQENPTCIGW